MNCELAVCPNRPLVLLKWIYKVSNCMPSLSERTSECSLDTREQHQWLSVDTTARTYTDDIYLADRNSSRELYKRVLPASATVFHDWERRWLRHALHIEVSISLEQHLYTSTCRAAQHSLIQVGRYATSCATSCRVMRIQFL